MGKLTQPRPLTEYRGPTIDNHFNHKLLNGHFEITYQLKEVVKVGAAAQTQFYTEWYVYHS